MNKANSPKSSLKKSSTNFSSLSPPKSAETRKVSFVEDSLRQQVKLATICLLNACSKLIIYDIWVKSYENDFTCFVVTNKIAKKKVVTLSSNK